MSAATTTPNIDDLVEHADPAWLWDVDRRRISWGNPAAVTFWGEQSLLDLIELEFDPDDPTLRKLDRLATEFNEGTSLTRKLEFDLSTGRLWTTCLCYPSVLDDGRPGLLIKLDQSNEASASFTRFGEMVQEAPIAMALFGTDGVLLHQNVEAERLFGVIAREGGLSALFEKSDDALPMIARTIRSGTVSRALTLTTRNGPRAHRVTFRRVHDPESDAQALLVLFRDVADRRAREKDAEQTQSQMQGMLNLVSDFQWRLDRNLCFTQITGGFYGATGIRAEALIGKSWDDVVQQFGLGPSPTLTEALSSKAPWREQELLWPKHRTDGKNDVVRLTLSALPLTDVLGKFKGWNGLASKAQRQTIAIPDQPARGPTQRQVLDPETLLASVTDGVLMLNAQGIVIRANNHAQTTLGAITGEPLVRALHPDDQSQIQDYLASLSHDDRDTLSSSYENGLEVRTASTPVRHLLLVMQALGDDYAGAAFTAALRDITLAKRTEVDLREALTQARTVNSQKTGFLTSIAHELRTPLNAIIGFSEIMRDERYGALGDERYLSYAGDIHDSGELLLSLINDLLDLSKVEAGKFEPEFEQVSIAALVEKCVNMVKPGAADERISIRTQIPKSLPGLVADKRSVTQILLNLLSNAVKFTRAGGQVTVSATVSADGDLTLAVHDTGIGMSDEDLEQALTPFGQARNAVTHGRKGTGLGLPLAKALTEANRGALTITSSPGAGTKVRLVFPSTQVLQD